jgi:NCAIR mutase (PurE)-related protein
VSDWLKQLMDQVHKGEIGPDEAALKAQERLGEPLGFAMVDHDRHRRCGAAEVIYAEGKTAAQVVTIAKAIRRHHPCVLVTRMNEAHAAALREAFAGEPLDLGTRGRTALIGEPAAMEPALAADRGNRGNRGKLRAVAIVSAGTSDEPVVEEAELTCRAMGHPTVRVCDVGVAGLHRLGARLPVLREAGVIICIAGMEGALPSVLGGLVDSQIVAVPTSVGYGAAMGGLAALMGMLTSCASGIVVVNIDNGFGGAMAACRINRLAAEGYRPGNGKFE